jgi:hypothetical protein
MTLLTCYPCERPEGNSLQAGRTPRPRQKNTIEEASSSVEQERSGSTTSRYPRMWPPDRG